MVCCCVIIVVVVVVVFQVITFFLNDKKTDMVTEEYDMIFPIFPTIISKFLFLKITGDR